MAAVARHDLLGTVEDYKAAGGAVENLPGFESTAAGTSQNPPLSGPRPPSRPATRPAAQLGTLTETSRKRRIRAVPETKKQDFRAKAEALWAAEERYVAKRIGVPAEQLTMHRGSGPKTRIGPEENNDETVAFWRQPTLGRMGLPITLTKPKKKKLASVGRDTLKRVAVDPPVSTERAMASAEVDAIPEAETAELEVVGTEAHAARFSSQTGSGLDATEQSEETQDKPTTPLLGFAFEGSPSVDVIDSVRCRMVLTSEDLGQRSSCTLIMHNTGSLAVFFSWKHLPSHNALGTHNDVLPRFFFSRQQDRLLPGERRAVQVVFQSPTPGVFTETWRLETVPRLDQAPSVVLCGIAEKRDRRREARERVEQTLKQRHVRDACRRLVHRIIDDVEETPRPPSPAEDWVTEEDLFRQANADTTTVPGYSQRVVNAMRILHKEAWIFATYPELAPPKPVEVVPDAAPAKGKKGKEKPPEQPVAPPIPDDLPEPPEWSLAVADLKKMVMSVKVPHTQHALMQKLSDLVAALDAEGVSSKVPAITRYDACYDVIVQLLEDSVGACAKARSDMGLAIPPMVIKLPEPAAPDPKDTKKGKRGKSADKRKSSASRAKSASTVPQQAEAAHTLEPEVATALAARQEQQVRLVVEASLDKLEPRLEELPRFFPPALY
eukprot:m.48452 g.48452  ORF g.48452 m.48452 type:complete len:665 (+) comp12000_c0_seq1:21-2015(+)